MKKKLFALCLGLCSIAGVQAIDNPVDYVNPLVGTQSSFALSTGNTYPAIALPWGMNFWTPQTGENGNGWCYTYDGQKIRGFKQTHQPSPWINDYGTFNIMPTNGDEPVFDQKERASWFSHMAEIARPYYYRVYLADYDITTEVTPTMRAAMFRITYPEGKSYLVVDGFDRRSSVEIIPEENKIVGYTSYNNGGVSHNFKNYFVLQFDRPFTYTAAVEENKINADSREYEGKHAGGIVGFDTKRGDQVIIRVASSFISPEQAELNLQRELAQKNFEQIKEEGKNEWNRVLSRVDIDDQTDQSRLRTFYSCLYRSVLFPRTLHEINADGKTVHYSPYNGEICDGPLFGDTGFWDTFRALFPLVNLIYPEMATQMQEGWANSFRESGFLPEWSSPGHRACMVGNNSASVVADAYLKGIRGYDIETLWKAVTHGANASMPRTSSGRAGWRPYNKLGYVPFDSINESAARTLEYAFADWSIYKLGQALGKPEKEIKVYAKHAMNYKNLFDSSYNLMRGKMANGEWAPDFSPFRWGEAFTEGNSWHYSWSVFHDPQGLIDLMGGRETYIAMLDSVFALPPIYDDKYYGGVIHEIREMQVMNMGNYAHGNQPIQHMIYMYNYGGEPWKSQYWLRETMTRMYNDQSDGYCGDEDNGQTSAWYVFTALGFYPVCPGADEYVLGAPYFKKVTLHLPNGKDVVINAPDNSDENRYVKTLLIDGAEWDKNYVPHSSLVKGMSMDYTMASTPNKQRGTSIEAAPYSFSRELLSSSKSKKGKK